MKKKLTFNGQEFELTVQFDTSTEKRPDGQRLNTITATQTGTDWKYSQDFVLVDAEAAVKLATDACIVQSAEIPNPAMLQFIQLGFVAE